MAITSSQSQNEGKTPYLSSEELEAADSEEELLSANGVDCKTLIIDVFVAILPLYFVGYAIAALIRDGTLANSVPNLAIFQMAKLNPTIFPILFTVIFAKFIKAIANWKLERGITVGHMQHLLGSRSLVSSVLTPIKLRTLSVAVPVLIMIWALNPIGGQLSLRTVTKESEFTPFDTQFQYADPGREIISDAISTDSATSKLKTIELGLNTALISPDTVKNGTQDLYGNIKLPMIEYLHQEGAYQDQDGWYYTAPLNLSNLEKVAFNVLNISTETQKLYSSLAGIPFVPQAINTTTSTDSKPSPSGNVKKFVQALEDVYFGNDVVGTTLDFTMETSYMYSDCQFAPTIRDIPWPSTDGTSNTTSNFGQSMFPNSTTGISSNQQGFIVAYDADHNLNSTSQRRIGLESWFGYNNEDTGDRFGALSQAWCNLTTTYVEAAVHCYSPSNCTVARVRPSTKTPDFPSYLTVLDGISAPADWIAYAAIAASSDSPMIRNFASYPSRVGPYFFDQFVNVTVSPDTSSEHNYQFLSPMEQYLRNTSQPYTYDNSGMGPISEIGNDLLSRRLTQLINTYWIASTLPYLLQSGLASSISYGNSYKSSSGTSTVETIVLRCHKGYTAVLMAIATGLVGIGLASAYLEAIRKGPDVLDDFVNSLRHSPYVHKPMGPSMEDGKDIVQRLKTTVVQMGDVRPDQPVGYVAIGTPNEVQPVDRLQTSRKYV